MEHEQGGQEKAEYGEGTLKQLSDELTQEFGKGFSLRNIETIRKFYLTYRKQHLIAMPQKNGHILIMNCVQ